MGYMDLKQKLIDNDYSICASNGYTSFERGIKPVIGPMNEDLHFFKDLIVADKLIGKASAMLLTLSGVKEVYTLVLSEAGKQIFDSYGITYGYDRLVDYIVNREGTGMCPMEMTVRDIDDLNEAFEALNRKLESLKKQA
jgi:iron complex outermembrane receptor protein